MGWLLCGLVLLGIGVLLAVAVPLIRRLRTNQAAVAALRATLDEASARLRVGQEFVRAWRHGHGGDRLSGPGA